MSTALMYSFAQRSDTRVLDEPLYGHFLARTGADRPDREATLKAWPTSEGSALESMAPGPDELLGDRVLFCKHIVNHSEGLPWSPFAQGRHVLLFRNPAAVMSSYSAHIERPSMRDVGYDLQCALLERLTHEGKPPIVLCSDHLQSAPEVFLRKLCTALGLEWQPAMMRWTPGPRPEDGPWAPWWYSGVHASSGWEARPPKTHAVPPHLSDLHTACKASYDTLIQHAI